MVEPARASPVPPQGVLVDMVAVRAPSIRTTRAAHLADTGVRLNTGVAGERKVEAGKRRRGRPAGSQNIHTIELRHAIQTAFAKLGGAAYLVKVGQSKPETFCALLARSMPTQHTGANGGPIEIVEVKNF